MEPAGFQGTTPQAAGQLFKELGLVVPSAHMELPLGKQKDKVLDAMHAIGCSRLISGKGPDDFKTMDLIKQTCDLFNEASASAVSNGLTFGVHNHWWEYQQVEGRWVYQVMLELLDPAIFFELDTYWIKTAGPDPALVVKEFGKKAPFLHIKDGPCVKGQPMTAIGDGVMDFPSIVKAGAGSTEWMVFEMDSCVGDVMTAVEKTYKYLVGNGLASGNK